MTAKKYTLRQAARVLEIPYSERIYSVEKAAQRLKISDSHCRRLLKAGKIKGKKLGHSWVVVSRNGRLHDMVTAWKEAELSHIGVSKSVLPLTVVKTCKNLLPEDVILVADAGTPTPYFASFYPSRAKRMFLSPRAFGSLGYAVPGAVGAHKGRPSSRIISLTGDGSMLVSMAELATLAREHIPTVVILFHNNEYGWIKVHQKYRKEQKYLSVDLPEVKYDVIAESMGLTSYVAETDGEFEETLKMALKTDEPTFIDAHTMKLHEIKPESLPWVVH